MIGAAAPLCPVQFATPPTDSCPTSALKTATRSRPSGASSASCADWSMFEAQPLFLPRHYLAHLPEFLPVEDMAGGAGRLRLERSRLGAVTGDARCDARD